ncbi:MAG TPA: hypothetical protein VFZ65_01800 [Planctomycetota bacterium]|nr:hypothetical protein [Planctomycetota bacterium]
MRRLVPALCAGCVVAIGITAYGKLGDRAVDALGVPDAPPTSGSSGERGELATALATARRQCTLPALDAVVQRLRERSTTAPGDRETFHVLAEALLERVQQHAHLRGLSIGTPLYDEVPAGIEADIDAGLDAVARARALGDDSSELFRIEAGLLGQRITGLAAVLQWNGKIQEALAKAAERAADNPQLHVALGVRKLLAPSLLGNDPERALEHFEFAARALLDDERPAVFAAMANYLQKKRQMAITWLEQAVARNPNNKFARVVLQRVRRGEEDAFARDVTAEEAAATR